MKETDVKKKASFVETRADGKNIQKECLVDLQTGAIEVGKVKIEGFKYDEKSPVVAARVEFRGQEYKVDAEKVANKTNYKLDGKEMGVFITESYKPKTITESKLDDINPRWKPAKP